MKYNLFSNFGRPFSKYVENYFQLVSTWMQLSELLELLILWTELVLMNIYAD